MITWGLRHGSDRHSRDCYCAPARAIARSRSGMGLNCVQFSSPIAFWYSASGTLASRTSWPGNAPSGVRSVENCFSIRSCVAGAAPVGYPEAHPLVCSSDRNLRTREPVGRVAGRWSFRLDPRYAGTS